MNKTQGGILLVLGGLTLAFGVVAHAQDWPQWRGANRDAKAADFKSPAAWPKEVKKGWEAKVGEGNATPALVGDRLYVFGRDGGSEIIRCLKAEDGSVIWEDKYEALGATGPSSGHAGPRSSPAVSGGKVVTYGVRGTVSSLDAQSGKVLWRKDDFAGTYPRFFTASSPIIIGDLCVIQLGGEEKGGIVAYELASGAQKWKWTEDGSAYASPVILDVDGTKMIAALTSKRVVGLDLQDGKLLWEIGFPAPGRAYNAATPIVQGATVFFTGSGRGTKAVRIEKADGKFAAKELWSNPDKSVQFNTPVLKNDFLYGLAAQNNEVYCIDAKTGKTTWTATLPSGEAAAGGGGRGRGGGGFGSIVDAGTVLMALTPSAQLIVFEPSEKEFKQLASYKVADSPTYAYPVPSGNRIFIKDKEALTVWLVQ